MTEKELQQIVFALKITFGEEEARRILVKLAHILFD